MLASNHFNVEWLIHAPDTRLCALRKVRAHDQENSRHMPASCTATLENQRDVTPHIKKNPHNICHHVGRTHSGGVSAKSGNARNAASHPARNETRSDRLDNCNPCTRQRHCRLPNITRTIHSNGAAPLQQIPTSRVFLLFFALHFSTGHCTASLQYPA